MNRYSSEAGGCVAVVILLFLAAAVIAAAIWIPQVLDTGAAYENARARSTDAETRQQHQQSVDFRHELETLAVILHSFTGGLTVKDVLLYAAIGVAAVFGAHIWKMKRRGRHD